MRKMIGKLVQIDTDDGEVIVGPLVDVKDSGYIMIVDAQRILYLPPWCIQKVGELGAAAEACAGNRG